jgi:hypothetical protein
MPFHQIDRPDRFGHPNTNQTILSILTIMITLILPLLSVLNILSSSYPPDHPVIL